MKASLLFVLAVATVWGQLQPPMPSRMPGPGIPFPGRKNKTTTTSSKSESDKTAAEGSVHIEGTVAKKETGSLVINSSDARVITVGIAKETKFPDGQFDPGDSVEIDAREEQDGKFTATSIRAGKIAKGTGNTVRTASADEERPRLQRGIPKPRKAGEQDDEAPLKPLPPLPPQLVQAREMAGEFLTGLPNYVCQQFTTRYISATQKPDWHAQDVVSSTVVYENGSESYRDVAVNGRSIKNMEASGGSWSTGEFGTVLADLFSPSTNTTFGPPHPDSASRRPATRYDYSVEQPFSHWTVMLQSQSLRPAYKGSIWVENKSGRVLRIESQAVQIPKQFPFDAVETTLDYDYVRLGTTEYLLPVHAENLSCQRGSNNCNRNVIEFRNYKKFTGEATITFDK